MNRRVVPVTKEIGATTPFLVTLLLPFTAAVRLCRRVLSGDSGRAQLGSMSERWITQHRASRPRH